ncbi:MAG: YlxR family protein [Ileibacterium sp.]|nr:YlxR family protein [Ileibacterium sp.]
MNTKVRKVPMRKCVVTQERFPKKELIRVVRTPENEIVVDETGKKNGHGAYVSRSLETIEKAKKNKALDRALEMQIGPEVYEALEELIRG